MNPVAFLQKAKHIKGLPYILLALAAGIILLIFPSGKGDTVTVSVSSGETYRAALEQEIAELIGEMEGIDSCRVVLTFSHGYEYLYATDQRVSESENGKEIEKLIVLATENGKEMPILLREKMPTVAGVAVVCPGADDLACLRIAQLLRALFSLTDEQISIQT